jgi:hypothetical protein
MEDIGGLIQHLECGGRMVIPRSCPNGVAQIISRCWKADPNVRPTFANLEHMLGIGWHWMEESVRTNDVDLNDPYSPRNAERFGSLVDEFFKVTSSCLSKRLLINNSQLELHTSTSSRRFEGI